MEKNEINPETVRGASKTGHDFVHMLGDIGRDLRILLASYKKYRRLNQRDEAVAAETGIRCLLEHALFELVKKTDAERGQLLLSDSKGEFRFHLHAGLNEKYPEGLNCPIYNEAIQKALLKSEITILSNPASKEDCSLCNRCLRSLLCLPIQGQRANYGFVYVDSRAPATKNNDAQIQLLTAFTEGLILAAESAQTHVALSFTRSELKKKYKDKQIFDKIVGGNTKILKVLDMVAQIADSKATVLVSGESGTGKELIARALHLNSSRREGPFQPVNCGAIAESLLESELFGYEKGAFTGAYRSKMGHFAAAHRGTLFLDQIESTSPALQIRLLRFLETGEYISLGSTALKYADVRIIAATNRDLKKVVEGNKFRDDLYYRLNVFVLQLPPLRDRKEDIPLLIEYYLEKICEGERCEKKEISEEALLMLMQYNFPGNIRELLGIIYRGVKLAHNNTIGVEHLPEEILAPVKYFEHGCSLGELKKRAADQVEKAYLIRALQKNHGVIRRAARMTGIDVKNFHCKIRKHGIDPKVLVDSDRK